MTVVLFALLAAVGAVARAVVTANQPLGRLPVRTLSVNATGSFVLGVVTTAGWWVDPVVVTVGGLGAFTTFSTVAAQVTSLTDDGHKSTAIAYVGLTVAAGVAAAWLGLIIGEQL